jgi:hypothetical protein
VSCMTNRTYVAGLQVRSSRRPNTPACRRPDRQQDREASGVATQASEDTPHVGGKDRLADWVFLISGMERVMYTFVRVFDAGGGGCSVNRGDELGRASYEARAVCVEGR